MRLGRDLDLRLQELAPDVAGYAEIRALEQRIRRLRRRLKVKTRGCSPAGTSVRIRKRRAEGS
jgi:hypothetical protein